MNDQTKSRCCRFYGIYNSDKCHCLQSGLPRYFYSFMQHPQFVSNSSHPNGMQSTGSFQRIQCWQTLELPRTGETNQIVVRSPKNQDTLNNLARPFCCGEKHSFFPSLLNSGLRDNNLIFPYKFTTSSCYRQNIIHILASHSSHCFEFV